MATRSTAPDLCVLSVGYQRILLPADKGLKVAALLRGALELKHATPYDSSGPDWEVEDELEVTFQTTKASNVRFKKPDQRDASRIAPALGHEPLKLPHA